MKFLFIVLFIHNLLAQEWPTNGWIIATPSEMGMDESKLVAAREYALSTGKGGGSGFITRSGKLVMAWGDPKKRYDIKSSTKSIGILALGLAIKDGLINLSDYAQPFHFSFGVPPQTNANTGWLEKITILQLAGQTAGFDKTGGYPDLLFEPGFAWRYSDGGPNWLAEILTLIFKEDIQNLMFNRIFSNLGITSSDLVWRNNRYRSDTIQGIKNREFGAGIKANVDAMARIGYLFLRNGKWEGQQLIPSSFIEIARSPIPEFIGLPSLSSEHPNAPNHYGLLIWNNADGTMPYVPSDTYFSWGLHESFIIVIPSLDIVVSRAGSDWRSDTNDWFYPVLEQKFPIIFNYPNSKVFLHYL